MSTHLTPLAIAERLMGGIERVAEIANRHPKAGYQWRYGRGVRHAGDLPSASVMRELLDHARRHHIPLTAEHLIYGATVAEVDALIAQMDAARIEAAE